MPQQSFFLFGPRQVGKSTLLGHLKTIFLVDLLDPEKQLLYSKDPGLLAKQVEATSGKGLVLIDEIQKVPKLLDIVHAMIEKHPAMRFAMSGSSARKLRHGAANLLGGRALYRTLHPLTLDEIGDRFNLDWALAYGTLPKIYSLLQEGKETLVQDLLRTYVITYLKEEIKAEAIVRNLQGFQNFLDVAAAQFAEQVNFADISRSCAVAYSTVREFYGILEDTLMGFLLYPCIKSARKRLSHSPKFYFFDNGVTRAILGMLRSAPSAMERGRLFEQWFIQEVYRLNQYGQKDWKLSFWRTSHGAEVDLVIERGNVIVCAIECKLKKNIAGADLSGMRSFRDAHPKASCYVVAPVELPLVLDRVKVLPPIAMLEVLKQF